jgi:hypothetical protein
LPKDVLVDASVDFVHFHSIQLLNTVMKMTPLILRRSSCTGKNITMNATQTNNHVAKTRRPLTVSLLFVLLLGIIQGRILALSTHRMEKLGNWQNNGRRCSNRKIFGLVSSAFKPVVRSSNNNCARSKAAFSQTVTDVMEEEMNTPWGSSAAAAPSFIECYDFRTKMPLVVRRLLEIIR